MQIDVDPDPEDKHVQQVLSVGFVFLFSFWFFGLVSKSVLKVKVAEKKKQAESIWESKKPAARERVTIEKLLISKAVNATPLNICSHSHFILVCSQDRLYVYASWIHTKAAVLASEFLGNPNCIWNGGLFCLWVSCSIFNSNKQFRNIL